jgi:hypothetical protein
MEQVLRLRRFLQQPAPVRTEPVERCEFCAAPLGPGHSHVVDIENRRLVCSCRPCWLLFTNPGAAGGKYRSAGDRREQVEDAGLDWTGLAMPAGMAFFIRSSNPDRVLGFYPSPGGATESGLTFEGDQSPFREIETDIEALLVYKRGARTEFWIVPVDACYELVGRIRRCWRGFDGGPEARAEIEGFFERLRDHRSVPWPA